jgi:hypothetical protein
LDYTGINLETLNSGAVLELFDVEWQKLLDNVNDPNTKPDAARKLKIEISVKPAKDRRNASSCVSVTTNLAAIVPHESSIVIAEKDGKVQAYSFDPRQESFGFEDEGKVTRFPKREAQ